MTQGRTVQVVIRGRVQGVGYRYWTRGEALRRALSGHVRNREDGAVEAVFSGPAEGVSGMVEACRRGPPGARVDDMAVTEVEAGPAAQGFAILHD